MLCAYTRPRYQVSVYRTIGPLVYFSNQQLFSGLFYLKNQAKPNILDSITPLKELVWDLLCTLFEEKSIGYNARGVSPYNWLYRDVPLE